MSFELSPTCPHTVWVVGRELAPGSDWWPKAEKVGWVEVGHRTLAGGGESRRPQGVSNSKLKTKNS
jgi:hypothetical protein